MARAIAAVLPVAAMMLVALGCGSGGSEGPAYTVDDVVAAGWTRSKELPAETLPQAIEVWYGFFDKRDVEVRVYRSAEDALEHGVGPAQEAVEGGERTFGENRALLRLQYGYEGKWTPGELSDMLPNLRKRYAAYLVVRNLVMLCEKDARPCETLASQIAAATR